MLNIFLSRLHRKFGFRPRLKRSKASFFRPAGIKVVIPKVPGGKEDIPKSAGHRAHIPCTTRN
ncbi:facilitated trehalose transporter Tret1 isoform X2 [Aphis craccivora]|uniref:Facilitated trehalose transporter Tret1 isoform X2 n=1 Tax=Aphis craccivora TaxID=307492 RepID=A0A6G0Y158_APHCR|nr:facilitated trehalose transporter Tret1 isoform X2 [Aphis craccivora]